MSEIVKPEDEECPMCGGCGEIEAVNLGEDGHNETVPCPDCISREHAVELARLRSSLATAREDMVKWHEGEIAKMETQIEENLAYANRSGAVVGAANDLCARTIMAHKSSIDAIRALQHKETEHEG